MEKYIGLENILDKSRIKYNEPMKNHTTMKVGGNCDCLVLPESIEEIKNIITYAKENKIDYYVIGNGSNLLVVDEGVHALIIKITNKFAKVDVIGEEIIATSGASMPIVSINARKNSLTGFEFACGIPGTIGGGVRMNAGAYGGEIADIFVEATYLDTDGSIKNISKEKMNFGYRHTYFSDNPELIILSAKFKLKKGSQEEIAKKMEENAVARRTKQPLEYPNFGSVFKRPEGYFVGKLVSDSGLRGYTIGGARVSEKHTGFIVNKNNATCKDIVELIRYVQKSVYEKYGVHLKTEVVFIGGEI